MVKLLLVIIGIAVVILVGVIVLAAVLESREMKWELTPKEAEKLDNLFDDIWGEMDDKQ